MIDLETAKQWYQAAADQSYDAVMEAQSDRDFRDGKQWTTEEIAELKRRKQPIVVDNVVKPVIDSLLGLEIKSRTDIKGFPRNPNDDEAAEAATDALRFIADNNTFDKIKTRVAEHTFIEGRAAGITEVVKKGDRFEIKMAFIPYDRYFIDPHSMHLDSIDKKYDGMAIWMDAEDAPGKYKDADPGLFEFTAENMDVHKDRPEDGYYDKGRNRVKIIDMFFNRDGWKRCIFTGGGFIVEPHDSPYLDDDGEPSNPIETVTGFLDRDNNPYGLVRQIKPLQREINARRSRALHLLNTRQIQMEKGAVEDVNVARREAAKADGVIVTNPGKEFLVNNTGDLAQGQMVLLQDAKNSAQSSILNPALTGDEPRNLSGRALQSRQAGATLEVTPILDQLRDWQKRMYIQGWNRVKQFWDEERWIRVTDDEKNVKFIALNRPITAREMLLSEEGGEEIVAQLEGDPRLEQIVKVENATADLGLDIILEDVPDIVNIQAEQFELLANVASSNPDAVPFEMLIEMSSIRNKDRILERLQGGSPEAQQANQARGELQQRGVVAQIAKDEAKAELDSTKAYQTQVETELAMMGREAI